MSKRPPKSRTYHSPLREAQAQRTEEIIMEALSQQITKEGLADFSIPKVAKRAGVSVRTVYRYFPTRDDLLKAVNQHWHRGGAPAIPSEVDALPAFNRELFGYFGERKEEIAAALMTNLGREVQSDARSARDDERRRYLQPLEEELGSELADRVRIGSQVLSSSATWFHLTHDRKLSSERAAEVCSWLTQLMVDEVNRRRAEARARREAVPVRTEGGEA